MFGDAGSPQRDEFVDFTEKCLGKTEQSFRWSQAQRNVLSELKAVVTAINCAPGAGKTTMIIALMLQVHLHLMWQLTYSEVVPF